MPHTARHSYGFSRSYGSCRPYGSGRRSGYHWVPQWRKPKRHYRRRDAVPEENDDLLSAIFSFEPPARGRDPVVDRYDDNLVLGLAALLGPLVLPLGLLSLLVLGLARLCGAPARRRALREAERTRRALRKQRTSSRLPPPTPEQLVEAWEKSRTSLEWKILLGSLLSDLEPVVDRSYIRDEDGEIVGRNPGIRGWIFEHCPELRRHYKAMMSYKTLAARLRRVCGLFDPDSAEALLRVRPEGRGEAPQASAEARAQARALLDAAPSMRALDDALCARLGLPRMRRERRRTA